MTECNRTPLLFASLPSKKIVADFEGGNLTSDGGLPLIREVDRKIGLTDALDDAINDPRNPALTEHGQRTLLAQRIFAIAVGYEDLNDHQALRNDTLLQALTDRRLKCGQAEDHPLSSPPTLCRLENRVRRSDLVRVAKVLVETFIASHAETPEELVLDFDAPDDLVHGQPVPRASVGGGVRADGDAALGGAGRNGVGVGSGVDDSAEVAEHRRPGSPFGSSAGDSLGQRLPAPGDVRRDCPSVAGMAACPCAGPVRPRQPENRCGGRGRFALTCPDCPTSARIPPHPANARPLDLCVKYAAWRGDRGRVEAAALNRLCDRPRAWWRGGSPDGRWASRSTGERSVQGSRPR